jgi:hypothetical protein
MIKVVGHNDLDTDRWDECIRQDSSGLFYGYSWYLDMLVPEWDALVYNDYEAVFPLIKSRKYGIDYLFRPYGTQQLGVFSKVYQSSEMIADFISAIPKNYRYIDTFLHVENPVNCLNPKWLKPNTNYVLSLERSYRKIYEGYSKQTLRNLKKAKKHKHSIFEYDSPDQLLNLFKANKGQEIETLSEANYSKILQIMHVMLHKRRGYLWTIYDERNTIIAGAFFVEMGGRIVLLFSATNQTGKNRHAMTYLLDELFIARAGDKILFDFEGSNIKGLARFYAGFGAVEQTYYNVHINRLPAPLKWIKR